MPKSPADGVTKVNLSLPSARVFSLKRRVTRPLMPVEARNPKHYPEESGLGAPMRPNLWDSEAITRSTSPTEGLISGQRLATRDGTIKR